MSQPCCETVHDRLHIRGRQCGNPARVEVEGQFYCAVHNPEAIKKRDAATRARWAEHEAALFIKQQRDTFDKRAGELLRRLDLTIDQAEQRLTHTKGAAHAKR